MKQLLFLLCLIPFFAFAQKGEVIKDTIFFITGVNECGDTVYFLTEIVELRGGRKFTNSQPVGFDENNPCVGIKRRDTMQLVNFYKNPLIDYGRQQSQKARDFIFQSRNLKGFNSINSALVRFSMPSPQKEIEKQFVDSLVGSYILVRPGVANANVTVTKSNQGAARIRVTSQTIFPLTVYSDTWMVAKDIAGTGQDVDLYQIEPGRWVSLLGNYQLVKNVRQVVSRTVK